MKLHYLTLALASLAFGAQAADTAAPAPVVPAQAAAPVATNGAPKTPEEWIARMTDFTKNASAFKDPKVFMPWSNTMTEPSFYVTMMNGAQDPAAWLNMMNSATNPNALRNYVQFTDPNLYMRWMGAGMDPAFYTAFMTQFSDPAKMMRWAMMPMDPKMWSAMMNMANPNMYMKWVMAPMDPRAWGAMGNMMNPATYTGFMGAGMDPKAYGPWGSMFAYTPQAPMGGVTNPWAGPTAGAGFNFFDANALNNMVSGLVPGVTAPTAAKAAAPAAPAAAANKLSLAGDALFKLSKSSIRDLSKEGKAQLDDIVAKIKAMGDISQIKVVGHSDPTGKPAANLKLSQARAKSIKSYLVSQGVKSDVIISSGVGAAQPVVQCEANLPKPQLRDCHAPNRRVEIEITPKSK